MWCSEFQDTDEQQLAMIIALAKPHGSTIVADDDQSIYSWRGAVRENVTKAQSALAATPFVLGANFRSDEVIVEAARAIIASDPGCRPKPMAAHSKQRGAIVVEAYGNLAAEAASVCTRITELTAEGGGPPARCTWRIRHKSRKATRGGPARRRPPSGGAMATARLPEQRTPSGARTPIIALSASVLEQDRAGAKAAGSNDFVSKPVQMLSSKPRSRSG